MRFFSLRRTTSEFSPDAVLCKLSRKDAAALIQELVECLSETGTERRIFRLEDDKNPSVSEQILFVVKEDTG